MPESTQLDRVEQKLNALGRAIGGPNLKAEWEVAERDLPQSARTFERRPCGCWRRVGGGRQPHEVGCEAEAVRRVVAGLV